MLAIRARILSKLQKLFLAASSSFVERLQRRIAFIARAEHLNHSALQSTVQGTSNERYCDAEIVVSLTTFGRRLYEVYLAIESIMQQTLKPNRIVLWLSDDLKNDNIPLVLQNQQKRGLEIKYCKDIRAYTKLIPALKAFPSAAIITIDDDQLYHFDLIENLVNAYKRNPKLIHCAAICHLKILGNNKIRKHKKRYGKDDLSDISPLNFPLGVGGVLYPPNCFSEEVFNEAVFMDICKYADDVWFKAMSLLNGTMAQKVFTHDIRGRDRLQNDSAQFITLNQVNKKNNMVSIQLNSVFKKYDLYNRLHEEAKHQS